MDRAMRGVVCSVFATLTLLPAFARGQQAEPDAGGSAADSPTPPVPEPPGAAATTAVAAEPQLPEAPPPPPGANARYYAPAPAIAPQAYSRPAPDQDVPQAAAATPARHWYGWQTLSADGISLALFVAGATSDGSGELMAVAGLSYLFVPPIIHAGHARVGMSFASFGVRVGLPMGGLFAGVASKDLGTAVVGLSLGVLGAVAMDSALFAWDAPEPEREATVARIAPTVAPVPGGASAGVIGVF